MLRSDRVCCVLSLFELRIVEHFPLRELVRALLSKGTQACREAVTISQVQIGGSLVALFAAV